MMIPTRVRCGFEGLSTLVGSNPSVGKSTLWFDAFVHELRVVILFQLCDDI
ncbi:hypothetical protein MTR_6g083030 [Medicago truncatula]|uniref:Uncharacterized protein n=1 Tax=Medicago truncatula TaxID=3880 RepID=A0A072UMC5_MEDTR|nr:hypothetical protein MTR_6g083030 [Medicago truncatula]